MSGSQELLSPHSDRRLEQSWRRPDSAFFAAGACHVLAAAFIEEYPREGFAAYVIRPERGYRGSHVFTAKGDVAFDWKGYRPRSQLEREYLDTLRSFFGEWRGSVVRVEDPISWEFCRVHRHRHPSQFFSCPLGRARQFVRRFPAPAGLLISLESG